MQWLDCSFDSPAHNLACDEALLEWREEEGGPDILRFWESPKYFVVLGYTNKIETETQESECARLGIPILRRTSGGGTVLQGPGCFNFSLILSIERTPQLSSVTGANDFVMECNCTALETLLNAPVTRQGHTDLTLGGRKFSGNAQRRKRKYLLFHGTLLFDFDLSLIEKVLQLPSVRPTYRHDRLHRDFLLNLHIARESAKSALCQAWQATKVLCDLPCDLPQERIELLAAQKYNSDDWNRKF